MASLMQKKMSKTQDHHPHHDERYHEGERALCWAKLKKAETRNCFP